jgi:hypothetical protein
VTSPPLRSATDPPSRATTHAISATTSTEANVPFIQIIEYTTTRIDELNAALDGWLDATKGKRGATRGVQTKDRDATNTYLQIVEFPSHEQAMANSDLPETSQFAAKLASLCDGPPTFRNLDVLREEQM